MAEPMLHVAITFGDDEAQDWYARHVDVRDGVLILCDGYGPNGAPLTAVGIPITPAMTVVITPAGER